MVIFLVDQGKGVESVAIAAATSASAKASSVPRGLVPAGVLMLGTALSLVGAAWDIQWHTDVGPDTFFTMPHLVGYTGSAVAGFVSLAVVLMTTVAQQRGKPVDPVVGGRAIAVFGRTFSAPAGYLVSGVGAAGYLLYGLYDMWWHGLYGFDATIASPPHIGILLSVTVTIAGAVMVFGAARHERWARIGIVVMLSIMLAFGVILMYALRELSQGLVDAMGVGVAFFTVFLLLIGMRALTRTAAFGFAAGVAVIQIGLWAFAPWITRIYAESVGLPLRDFRAGNPLLISAGIPVVLVVVAAALLLLHHRPGWLMGAVGGLIIGACAPVQRAFMYSTAQPGIDVVIATGVVGLFFGALAGFLGARFGEILRRTGSRKDTADA